MKKKFLRSLMAIAIAISLTWTASAQTLTLDISSSSIWTDSVTALPNSCRTGGFWSDTYGNTTGFQIGSFKFTHNSGFDIYSYWGGFTTGANGNSRCYCSNCYDGSCTGCPDYCTVDSLSGSWGWIHNQWGIMAGGGLSSTFPITATKGVPYLIAYWDYYSETGGTHSLKVKLNGDSLFNLQEFYVCNHPWPYYGNFFGDGFARPLNQPGDYFKLIIHGVRANGTEVTPQELVLAQYDPQAQYDVSQSPDWQIKTFRGWNNLKSIYFTMESTDEYPPYGPNTAVYFCLDKLKVYKTGGVASASAIAPQKKAVTTSKTIKVTDYFPITSYTGGVVVIYNNKGQEISKFIVKAGEKIDLSGLSEGKYRMRHGQKSIPFTKLK